MWIWTLHIYPHKYNSHGAKWQSWTFVISFSILFRSVPRMACTGQLHKFFGWERFNQLIMPNTNQNLTFQFQQLDFQRLLYVYMPLHGKSCKSDFQCNDNFNQKTTTNVIYELPRIQWIQQKNLTVWLYQCMWIILLEHLLSHANHCLRIQPLYQK